ncbi:MAG: AP2 domain-containing protein [Phycisphaerae bacterium]
MRILFAPLLLYRKYKYDHPFMRIELTQNQYAIVDFDDFCKLTRFEWYAYDNGNTFYAVRPGFYNGFPCFIRMHRVIMNAKRGVVIDHIDHNGLNNCKYNLRPATPAENRLNNRRGFNSPTSKYKGVFYDKRRNKFRAVISIDGKKKHLGYFDNEIDAAKAYDKAARESRGRFAVLNFE